MTACSCHQLSYTCMQAESCAYRFREASHRRSTLCTRLSSLIMPFQLTIPGGKVIAIRIPKFLRRGCSDNEQVSISLSTRCQSLLTGRRRQPLRGVVDTANKHLSATNSPNCLCSCSSNSTGWYSAKGGYRRIIDRVGWHQGAFEN